MKKLICIVILAVFFMATSGISFALESIETKDSAECHHKEMKRGGMEGTHGMYAKKMMMDKEMAASGDGGVIVLMGNKLLKYDKDLNLVKEAEIKIDIEEMMKKCKEMKEKAIREESSE